MGQTFLHTEGSCGSFEVGKVGGKVSVESCWEHSQQKTWLFLCNLWGGRVWHQNPPVVMYQNLSWGWYRGSEIEKIEAEKDGGHGGRKKDLREEDQVNLWMMDFRERAEWKAGKFWRNWNWRFCQKECMGHSSLRSSELSKNWEKEDMRNVSEGYRLDTLNFSQEILDRMELIFLIFCLLNASSQTQQHQRDIAVLRSHRILFLPQLWNRAVFIYTPNWNGHSRCEPRVLFHLNCQIFEIKVQKNRGLLDPSHNGSWNNFTRMKIYHITVGTIQDEIFERKQSLSVKILDRGQNLCDILRIHLKEISFLLFHFLKSVLKSDKLEISFAPIFLDI